MNEPTVNNALLNIQLGGRCLLKVDKEGRTFIRDKDGNMIEVDPAISQSGLRLFITETKP